MTDQPAINLRRGLCRICGRWIDLTQSGKLRSHQHNGAKCSGVRPAAKMKVFAMNVEFKIERK